MSKDNCEYALHAYSQPLEDPAWRWMLLNRRWLLWPWEALLGDLGQLSSTCNYPSCHWQAGSLMASTSVCGAVHVRSPQPDQDLFANSMLDGP